MTALSPRVGKFILKQVRPCVQRAKWGAAVGQTFLFLLLLAPLVAAQSNEPKRVLLLMQEDPSWPMLRLIDGKSGQNNREDVKVGFVEAEETDLPDNQSRGDLLVCGWDKLLVISDILPGNAAIDAYSRVVGVFEVATDPAAESGLELDTLL